MDYELKPATASHPEESWVLEVDTDEDESAKPLVLAAPAALSRRDVSLWRTDAAFLLLDFFQFYSIFLAIASENGIWPTDWVNGTYLAAVTNLDVWELARNRQAYTGTSVAVPSSAISIDFFIVSYAITLAPLALALAAWLFLHRYARQHPASYAFMRARVTRVAFLLAYALYMPYGVAQARLCHCVADPTTAAAGSVLDVDNSIVCLSSAHLMRLVPALVAGLPVLLATLLLFTRRIRAAVFAKSAARHDGHVVLKEREYLEQVDDTWLLSEYYLFSSYRRHAVLFKPLMLVVKALFLLSFALLRLHPQLQVALLFGLLVLLVAVTIHRPVFRLRTFHVCLEFLLFGNVVNALLVLLPTIGVSNALLTVPYFTNELAVSNATFVGLVLLCLLALELVHRGVVGRGPVWPTSPLDTHPEHPHTPYRVAMLARARRLLAAATRMSPVVAPAHEVARQIQIINACFRDAAIERDVLAGPLQDVLDELIELHNRVAPVSIFASSIKRTTRQTAAELFALMPVLRRAMDARADRFLLSHTMHEGAVKRVGFLSRVLLRAWAAAMFRSLLDDVRARGPSAAGDARSLSSVSGIIDIDDDLTEEDFFRPATASTAMRPSTASRPRTGIRPSTTARPLTAARPNTGRSRRPKSAPRRRETWEEEDEDVDGFLAGFDEHAL